MAANSSASVDVVIPTWEGRAMLTKCLDALQQQTITHRVYVVDNGSSDGTVEFVNEKYPKVDVLALEKNIGFGAAVNRGVERGDGSIVVLLNNDTEANRDFLERLIEPLADERVGMVAGKLIDPKSGKIDSFGIETDATLLGFNYMQKAEADVAGDSDAICAPCAGAGAYLRTAYEQVGGFDEHFFAYGEDLDIGLRIGAAGWSTVLAPAARVMHLGGATSGSGSRWQMELYSFGRGYTLAKYGVLSSRHALRAFATELLVTLSGILNFRTTAPMTQRIKGYRLGKKSGERVEVPAKLIGDISWAETFRRLFLHRRG